MYKRFVVEIGTGVDLHGADVTKAGKKAVKDAISHSCLCGITELLGMQPIAGHAKILVQIAAPHPEEVDTAEIAKILPFGEAEVTVTPGGMTAKGLAVPSLGAGDTIVVVNAALTVFVDT